MKRLWKGFDRFNIEQSINIVRTIAIFVLCEKYTVLIVVADRQCVIQLLQGISLNRKLYRLLIRNLNGTGRTDRHGRGLGANRTDSRKLARVA
ncbi:hypothetical protein [Vibrio navarrensis]|uniref:hypothetical protein n=1 Tax=Vibrio navarrensis TaxID=29495 RepID=UPI00126A5E8A|nr:hypothetical protein [Vibrio navarrensis]